MLYSMMFLSCTLGSTAAASRPPSPSATVPPLRRRTAASKPRLLHLQTSSQRLLQLVCRSHTKQLSNPGASEKSIEIIMSVKDANATRVAIFRDREKDRSDPDYDRSYGRYATRTSMSAVNLVPFNVQITQPSFAQYDTTFNQLVQMPPTQASLGYIPHSQSFIILFGFPIGDGQIESTIIEHCRSMNCDKGDHEHGTISSIKYEAGARLGP